MMIERKAAICQKGIDNLVLKIHEINPDLLQNPNKQDEEVYIGRGSFAIRSSLANLLEFESCCKKASSKYCGC